MIGLLLNIVLCLLLASIIYQDFKYRAIHFLLVIGVFAIGTILLWLDQKSVLIFLINSVFVLIIMTLLWLYISIKQHKLTNPFTHNIGIGDVLFFFAITPFFSLHHYMVFFISGMILTLLFSLVFKKLISNKLIPLAGILAGFMIFLKGLALFIPVNFYDNSYFNI